VGVSVTFLIAMTKLPDRDNLKEGKTYFGSHLAPCTWAKHHGSWSQWQKNFPLLQARSREKGRKEAGPRHPPKLPPHQVTYFLQARTYLLVSKPHKKCQQLGTKRLIDEPMEHISYCNSNSTVCANKTLLISTLHKITILLIFFNHLKM
jgi:hypothetical protein